MSRKPTEANDASIYETIEKGADNFMKEQQQRQRELQEKLKELEKENPLRSLTEQDIKQKSYLVQTFDRVANPLELIGYFNGYGFNYTYKTDRLELQDLTESELIIKYPFDYETYFSKVLEAEICIITETATLSDFYFKRAAEFDKRVEKLYKELGIPTLNGNIRNPDYFPIFRQTGAYFRGEEEPIGIDGYPIYVEKSEYQKPEKPPENLRGALEETARKFVEFFNVEQAELSKNSFIAQLKKLLEGASLPEKRGYTVETADYILYSQRYLELQLKLLKALIELDFKPESENEGLENDGNQFKPMIRPGKKNFLKPLNQQFKKFSEPLTQEKKLAEKYNGKDVFEHEITNTINGEAITSGMLTIQPPKLIKLNQERLKIDGIAPTALYDTINDLSAVCTLIAPLEPSEFPCDIPAKLINDQLAYKSFSKGRRERLAENMEIARHTEYNYDDWEEEAQRRIELGLLDKDLAKKYEEATGLKFYEIPKSEVLLNNQRLIKADEYGNLVEVYRIFQKPYYLTHTQITRQIATIPREFIDTDTDRKARITELKNKIYMEIAERLTEEQYHLKRCKEKQSKDFYINIENFCKKLEIPLNNRQAKSKILGIILERLTYLREQGYIDKYEEVKEGKGIKSVKVTITRKNLWG